MHGGGVRAGDLDSRRAQRIVVGSDFFFLALQNLRIPFSLGLATSPSPTAQVAEEHGPRFLGFLRLALVTPSTLAPGTLSLQDAHTVINCFRTLQL